MRTRVVAVVHNPIALSAFDLSTAETGFLGSDFLNHFFQAFGDAVALCEPASADWAMHADLGLLTGTGIS